MPAEPDNTWTIKHRWPWLLAINADRKIPGSAVMRVAVVLAQHATNDEGYAWPANSTTAEVTGLKISTVRKATRQLKEHGYIVPADRAFPKIRSRVWRLIPVAEGVTPVTPQPLKGVTGVAGGCHPSNTRGVTPVAPNLTKELNHETRAREAGSDQPTRPPGLVDPPEECSARFWPAIEKRFRAEHGETVWRNWVKAIAIAGDGDGGIVLIAASDYAAKYLRDYHGEWFDQAWSKAGLSYRIVAP